MRRDIGNELVVAIAAVGVLAFALIFGVILSVSNPFGGTAAPTSTLSTIVETSGAEGTAIPTLNPTEMSEILQQGTQVVALLTASAQADATDTSTPNPTATRTISMRVPTVTETEPSETNTRTATPTRTTRPSNTSEPTHTNTRTLPPTRTDTAEPTETLLPSPNVSETFESLRTSATAFAGQPDVLPSDTATPTRTIRPSNTSEPTDTPTRTASRTRTRAATAAALAATDVPTLTPVPTDPPPTDTPVPTNTPTRTPSDTPSNTATPSHTPTRTASSTSIPSNTPSFTPTATATQSPSVTNSATPTRVLTAIPMETDFVLPTAIILSGNVPIPTVLVIGTPVELGECILPQGWTIYVVQSGDTLFRIALAVGSTVGELRDANCLENVDNIIAGTQLFVPRAPSRPIQPAGTSASPLGTSSVAQQGCTNPGAQITAPLRGQAVTGVFTLFGTATVGNFQYYRIEVRPDSSSIYNFYDRVETPVVNNALAQINTDLFDDGLHWVRLTVVDNTGNFPEPCAIPLLFH